MRADGVRAIVDAIGIDTRGDETGAIAEGVRIEVSGDLLDDAVALEPLGAFDDLLLRHVDHLPHDGKRSRHQGNLTLQGSQQLPVPLINVLHYGSSTLREVNCGDTSIVSHHDSSCGTSPMTSSVGKSPAAAPRASSSRSRSAAATAEPRSIPQWTSGNASSRFSAASKSLTAPRVVPRLT